MEKCEENFEKQCDIEFEIVAENKTELICREPLILDKCIDDGNNDDDNVKCQTEYETKCTQRFDEVQVLFSLNR